MNDIVKDLKKKFLQKKLNAIESINQVAKELDTLAKDDSVINAIQKLNKIESLIKQFNLNDTNQLIK